ncbi:MAG: hypothetical protein HY996_07630 [Micrococcales bacterium]|nr:hypothetical protein [Micrococcales bacterium]
MTERELPFGIAFDQQETLMNAVMVTAADCSKVLGIVVTLLTAQPQMVDLDPRRVPAAIYSATSAVTADDLPPDGGRDRLRRGLSSPRGRA